MKGTLHSADVVPIVHTIKMERLDRLVRTCQCGFAIRAQPGYAQYSPTRSNGRAVDPLSASMKHQHVLKFNSGLEPVNTIAATGRVGIIGSGQHHTSRRAIAPRE